MGSSLQSLLDPEIHWLLSGRRFREQKGEPFLATCLLSIRRIVQPILEALALTRFVFLRGLPAPDPSTEPREETLDVAISSTS